MNFKWTFVVYSFSRYFIRAFLSFFFQVIFSSILLLTTNKLVYFIEEYMMCDNGPNSPNEIKKKLNPNRLLILVRIGPSAITSGTFVHLDV